MKQKLSTAWTVFKSGVWVTTLSTVLTAGVTYGVFDAADKGAVVNAATALVNAVNLALTAAHSFKTHKEVTTPTATVVVQH
jgi:TRAP-type C4-dicarboxylate transport system permease large subunit